MKRKRAEKVREAEKQPSEESEQPDLGVISRGLPSGWQVSFWLRCFLLLAWKMKFYLVYDTRSKIQILLLS